MLSVVDQESFLEVELAELLDVLLMLSAAPVVWEGNSGLKLRDFIVEISRWVLGPKNISTVNHHRSKEMPHVFFYRKGPALGIKPLVAFPTRRGTGSNSQHLQYCHESHSPQRCFHGRDSGYRSDGPGLRSDAQVDLCSATVQEVQSAG